MDGDTQNEVFLIDDNAAGSSIPYTVLKIFYCLQYAKSVIKSGGWKHWVRGYCSPGYELGLGTS